MTRKLNNDPVDQAVPRLEARVDDRRHEEVQRQALLIGLRKVAEVVGGKPSGPSCESGETGGAQTYRQCNGPEVARRYALGTA